MLLFFLLDSHATRARTATYVNVCPSRVVFFFGNNHNGVYDETVGGLRTFFGSRYFFALYAHIYTVAII